MREAPELRRIVVAIDLAVSNNEGSDETGIVVVGIGGDKEAYVLEGFGAIHAARMGS